MFVFTVHHIHSRPHRNKKALLRDIVGNTPRRAPHGKLAVVAPFKKSTKKAMLRDASAKQLQTGPSKIRDGDALQEQHKKGVCQRCLRKTDSCTPPREKHAIAKSFETVVPLSLQRRSIVVPISFHVRSNVVPISFHCRYGGVRATLC